MADRLEVFEANGFTAGEMAPELHNRTDLDRYDLAVARAENFLIDYRSGIASRPGFTFKVPFPGVTRRVAYPTGENQSDQEILFSDQVIRILQDGAFLLQSTSFTISSWISSTRASLSGAHGLAAGALVEIVGQSELPDGIYLVDSVPSTTDLVLSSLIAGTVAGSTADGTVTPVIEIATPYLEAELDELGVHYKLNTMTITHKNHFPRQLSYDSFADSWALNTITIGEVSTGVTASSMTFAGSTTGSASFIWTVTAVDADGNESLPAIPMRVTGTVNITTTAGWYDFTWGGVAGAAYYNVYRSLITQTYTQEKGATMGFIGSTKAPELIDNNIVPDFTQRPPSKSNPFVPGSILAITVTSAGSSYDVDTTTVSISTSTGSGFSGYCVFNQSAQLTRIVILSGGQDYAASDTVTFGSVGSGTGAAATIAELSTDDYGSLYPGISTVFQQRRVYTGIEATPLTLHGSKVGAAREDNFDYSEVLNAGDAYTITLDDEASLAIRAAIPRRKSLLLFHARGVHRLYNENNPAVTALEHDIEKQTDVGIGDVRPLAVNDDMLYFTHGNHTLYSMEYTLTTNSFDATDRTILASHLFSENNQAVAMAWAEMPDKVLWVVREDGALLSMTYAKEQNIVAWARHYTKGYFRDVTVVREGSLESVYVTVEREVNGTTVYYLEKLQTRQPVTVEFYNGLDSSLVLFGTQGSAPIRIAESGATAAITTSGVFATVFSGLAVDDIIRAGDGVYKVTNISSPTVTVDILHEITKLFTGETPWVPAADWFWNTPATAISGLDHLEGETVGVYADGNFVGEKTVSSGGFTLDTAASYVIAGLRYTGTATTLPLYTTRTVSNGLRKQLMELLIRINESRGLKISVSATPIELKTAPMTMFDIYPPAETGLKEIRVPSGTARDLQITFTQEYPLPANILGYVARVALEDFS